MCPQITEVFNSEHSILSDELLVVSPDASDTIVEE